MIEKVIRANLTEEELQKRLSEVRKIAGLIVKDIEKNKHRAETHI